MPEHLWTAIKEVTNLERPTDYILSKKKQIYGKTSILKEMFE